MLDSWARCARPATARVAVAALLLATLSGCVAAGGSPTDAGSHPGAAPHPGAEAARETHVVGVALTAAAATSDFERAAFSDGVISEAEYAEAMTLYTSCMGRSMQVSASGPAAPRLTLVRDRYGLYSVESPRLTNAEQDAFSTSYDDANAECAPGTTQLVAPLFAEMTLNPGRLSPEQLTVECFTRHGLVGASYTVSNFHADAAAHHSEPYPFAFDPAKATGLDWSDAEVENCRVTPWD